MKPLQDYIAINKNLWNEKTAVHVQSDFYDMPAFLQGQSSLKSIELELLGNIKGKSILHLQCHFGQDSISLSKLGAQVTGIDLSDKAIAEARQLAKTMQTDTEFICCNLYDLPQHLDREFDIVFTSYGTIGWLPDMDEWASIISRYLKPGGDFIFVEFHPVVWMFDDDFTKVVYNYFKAEAIVEDTEGTYANQSAGIKETSVSWNHSLSEVFTALLKKGLSIEQFQEFDYSPYNCLRHMEEVSDGRYQIKHLGNKLPMVYALKAHKKR